MTAEEQAIQDRIRAVLGATEPLVKAAFAVWATEGKLPHTPEFFAAGEPPKDGDEAAPPDLTFKQGNQVSVHEFADKINATALVPAKFASNPKINSWKLKDRKGYQITASYLWVGEKKEMAVAGTFDGSPLPDAVQHLNYDFRVIPTE